MRGLASQSEDAEFMKDLQPDLDIEDGETTGVIGYSGAGNVIGALMGRGIARWLVGRDDQLLRPFLS